MKKLLLLLVSIVMIFTLASCGDPEIVGYHIDENGKLIVTYEDDTTVDLGTLTDTIANGANTITVNNDGYYVINCVVSKIEAKLPKSYSIDIDGNLIITYTDTTTENLGKFGNDAINTIDTIAISDDGFYVLNGIKTSIVAFDVFEVKFVTGYDATVKTQIIKDGDKVERPQLDRAGYTLKGWYCNGEEWRFNSDVVLNEMTLVAEWIPNAYSITFDSDGGNDIASMTIATGDTLNLPTPQRDLYTFDGWYFNGNNKVNSSTTFNYATDLNLVAKWHRTQYAITFDTVGGNSISPINVDSFSQITELPTPTKNEFEFLGWYVNDNKVELPYNFTEGNMTLTAHWRGVSEDWDFVEDDTGAGIKLLNYKGNNVEVIIPTTLGGKPVTTIASNAFKNQMGLKRIDFSNVTNFEYKAISGCESLEKIELLGETNTTLVYIFGGESNIPNSLKEIIFSENSTTFGDWIFDEIASTTRTFTVYVNAKIANAPEDAFYDCSSIDKIYFSDTITKFDSRVICTLPNLTYVDLPDNLKSVGMNNFMNCPKLLYVVYPISLVSSRYGGLCASKSVILVESDSRPSGWASTAFSIYEEDLNIFYGFEKLVETEDFLYALCKVGSTKRCVIIQRYNSNAVYPEFIEDYPVVFKNDNYTNSAR